MTVAAAAPALRSASPIDGGGPVRRTRADARRNHDRLIAVAKTAFAEIGPEVSLDEIARRAGVGIGTLYRHFPTRDSMVEAVYRREVEQLAAAATRLLGSLPPAAALHEWMRLFVDYIATKKVMASALGAIVDCSSALYAASGVQLGEAMTLLVRHGVAAGAIRPDIDAIDLLRALVGFTLGNSSPGWQASALRLIEILMDGLRTVPAVD